MSTPTHIATGMLLGHAALATGFIITRNPSLVMAAGILAANLPDLDVPFYPIKKNHRLCSPFHQPFWWLCGLTIIMPVVRVLRPDMLVYLWLMVAGLISHFVMDLYDVSSGIMIFAPFSRRVYSFFRVKQPDERTLRGITKSFIRHNLLVESVVVTALYVASRMF